MKVSTLVPYIFSIVLLQIPHRTESMRNEILGCVVSAVILSSLFTSAHAQNNRTSSIADRVREMDDDDLICKLNICLYRVGGNRETTLVTHISIAAFWGEGGIRKQC